MSTLATHPSSVVLGAGIYDVDPVHSRVGFAVRHLGINVVRGSFARFTATIEVTDPLSGPVVAATIAAESVDTGFAPRDEHLRTADFLDAGRWPELTFASIEATPVDHGIFRVVGDLTVRGVTRPIVLDAELGGSAVDQYGNHRLGLRARGRLRRRDFGLPFDEAPGGVALVGDKVELLLDVEAVRRP